VSEFDAEYQRLMDEARARARGRNDVVDYLNLRAVNDRVRAGGIEWLFTTFASFAGEANRSGAGINFTRTDAHRFRVGNSTMVGERLTLTVGVRSLTVEAGWPRAPRDGIVRGGGLAAAKVAHFGERSAGEELLLIPSGKDAPRWFALDDNGARSEFLEDRVRRHVNRLSGKK
jgi:hypothetical protein